MWVQLGNEYLNLNHVSRVRFNDGWKHGDKHLVAEIETFHQGEMRLFTRVRGPEAEALRTALEGHRVLQEPILQPSDLPIGSAPTLADI